MTDLSKFSAGCGAMATLSLAAYFISIVYGLDSTPILITTIIFIFLMSGFALVDSEIKKMQGIKK